MAKKRMFSLQIVDTDAFLDMPASTQNLYFHLCMRADDDGFINNPKKIIKMVNASSDDLKVLLFKRFVLGFESGIIVIKHWKIHNYIAKDRYHKTIYLDEKTMIKEKLNGVYTECNTKCIQNVDSDKIRLDKVSIDNSDNLELLKKSYPTKCPVRNTSTKRSVFNKEKAIKIINDIGLNEAIEIIELYINDCKKNNSYMQNFGTFINNFPCKDDFEKENKYTVEGKKIVDEVWEVDDSMYND